MTNDIPSWAEPFMDTIKTAVAASGLPASRANVEIKESRVIGSHSRKPSSVGYRLESTDQLPNNLDRIILTWYCSLLLLEEDKMVGFELDFYTDEGAEITFSVMCFVEQKENGWQACMFFEGPKEIPPILRPLILMYPKEFSDTETSIKFDRAMFLINELCRLFKALNTTS